jgi:hypothetical protein
MMALGRASQNPVFSQAAAVATPATAAAAAVLGSVGFQTPYKKGDDYVCSDLCASVYISSALDAPTAEDASDLFAYATSSTSRGLLQMRTRGTAGKGGGAGGEGQAPAKKKTNGGRSTDADGDGDEGRVSTYRHHQYETRLGGVQIPWSTLMDAVLNKRPTAAPVMPVLDLPVIDDAVEYAVRTASTRLAQLEPTALDAHQLGWRLRVSLQTVTGIEEYMDSQAGGDGAWGRLVEQYRAGVEAAGLHTPQARREGLARGYALAAEYLRSYVGRFAPFKSLDAQPDIEVPGPLFALVRSAFDMTASASSSSSSSSQRVPATLMTPRNRLRALFENRAQGSPGDALRRLLGQYFSKERLQSPTGLQKLAPKVAALLSMHMPSVGTVTGPMPVGYYYAHEIDFERVDGEVETLLKPCLDSCIRAAGLASGAAFWTAIRDCLVAERSRSFEQGYAACHALASFLVELSMRVKYRADYSFLASGKSVPVDRQDFDCLSRASGSGDCEDSDLLSQQIARIVLRGRSDIPFSVARKDDKDDEVLRAMRNSGGEWSVLRTSGAILGTWESTEMRAAQYLLAHYAPISILCSATNARPDQRQQAQQQQHRRRASGESATSSSQQQLREDREFVECQMEVLRFMGYTTSMPGKKKKKKEKGDEADRAAWTAAGAFLVDVGICAPEYSAYVQDSRQDRALMPLAHRCGVLYPLAEAAVLWADSMELTAAQQPGTAVAESDVYTSARLAQILRDTYRAAVAASQSRAFVLPTLVLESTSRVSPYLVGASEYLAASLRRAHAGASTKHEKDVRRVDAAVQRELAGRRWRKNAELDRLMRSKAGERSIEFQDTHIYCGHAYDSPTKRSSLFYRDVLHMACPWMFEVATPHVRKSLWRVRREQDASIILDDRVLLQQCTAVVDAITLCVVDSETGFMGTPLEWLCRSRWRPTRRTTPVLGLCIGHLIPQQSVLALHSYALARVWPLLPPVAVHFARPPQQLKDASVFALCIGQDEYRRAKDVIALNDDMTAAAAARKSSSSSGIDEEDDNSSEDGAVVAVQRAIRVFSVSETVGTAEFSRAWEKLVSYLRSTSQQITYAEYTGATEAFPYTSGELLVHVI